MARIEDVDGDGWRDVLVGVPGHARGFVVALSASTGETLFELGDLPGPQSGAQVAAAGDLDGDGRAEIVVTSADVSLWDLLCTSPGERPRDATHRARVQVFSIADLSRAPAARVER